MPSIDTLITAISAVAERIRAVGASLASSRETAEELQGRFASLGAGDKAEQVQQIGQGVTEQQAAAAAAEAQAEVARTRAEALRGAQGPRGSGAPAAPLPGAEPPWAKQSPIPGFTHRKPVSACIAAVRREGWPINREGRVSARGFLYTGDGHQVNTATFRPHRKGQAPPCEDLKEPWRSDEHFTTTWHAERDAALIRKYRVPGPVLYLNVPTCGKESSDPERCHANLEKILPRGTELYVWTIHEDGSRARRRYVGTGEALDD